MKEISKFEFLFDISVFDDTFFHLPLDAAFVFYIFVAILDIIEYHIFTNLQNQVSVF